MPNPSNLRVNELETLVNWFLLHMGIDQRARFMAEMPLTYAKLYPDVSASRIASMVDDAIRNSRTKK